MSKYSFQFSKEHKFRLQQSKLHFEFDNIKKGLSYQKQVMNASW